MPYNTKKMLRDASNNLIPQLYDPVNDEFVPLSRDVYNTVVVSELPTNQVIGVNVENDLNLNGYALQEQLTEANATNGTLTFSDVVDEIEIYNRDSVDGTFTVNGMSLLIPAGEAFQARVGGTASNTVTVANATSYVVGRYA